MDVFTEPRDYSWNFEIAVDPVSKNGWKTTSRGFQYKPTKVRNYETAVSTLLRDQAPEEPLSGPLLVRIIFFLPRPSSHFTKKGEIRKGFPEFPTRKNAGDVDNLSKSFCDSCNGIIWHDDSQIIDLHLFKRYSPQGVSPRVIISVECVDGEEIL